jgi:hypothetical protein
MLDAIRPSAPALTEREQCRNAQRCPIRGIRPEPMTRGAGVEDQTGRTDRTGNVERQRFLNSPPNSGGALDITPFEQFEPPFTHTASTSLHHHLTSRAYTITRVLARGMNNILFFLHSTGCPQALLSRRVRLYIGA